MAHDAPTPTSTLPAAEEAVLAAVRDDLPRSLAELGRLVRIPSVSWDGFDATRVAASAEAIAELARETGAFDEVSIRSSTIGDSDLLGQPAVLATRVASKPSHETDGIRTRRPSSASERGRSSRTAASTASSAAVVEAVEDGV